MLLPSHLNALNVRARSVDLLSDFEACKLPSRRGRLHRVDRIRQVFVEPAGLNDADGFQIVFEQKIEIVGMRGY